MTIKHFLLALIFSALTSLHIYATTLTVTNTSDSGGDSLRQAIAGAASGDDIEFTVTGTITLTSGQLVIDKNLTIQGPGASLLAISGNNTSRVFYINAGVTVEIGFVTIKDGRENDGAGITNAGTLTVSSSIISGNSAGYFAGGIRNFNRMTVLNSVISGNTARLADGGLGNSATMTVSYSHISGNTAGGGGAVWNGGPLTIINSTISGNAASGSGGSYYDFNGGAIYNEDGTLTINNSTISGNSAKRGSGIFNTAKEYIGTVRVTNGTISNNDGGGIHSAYLDYSIEALSNTLVAGNTGPNGDIYGTIEIAHYNLISNAASSGGITNGVNGNIVGVDPLLGPLQNNGGTTPTHALIVGSPAIDKGLNRLISPLLHAFDQRGTGFARIRDGNNDGRTTVDIGAFEVQSGATGSRTAGYDFDGDGRSDISVFRPTEAVWYLNRSTDGSSATHFGVPTDKITPADYDADGKTDISIYRDGTWWRVNSSNNTFGAVHFGMPNDIPVPADYTGDGRAELAVYRSGTWILLDLSNNQINTIQFGISTDKPVASDYDGDGRADQAVYRSGEWHMNRSSKGYAVANFGLAVDIPVVGDYDGDGKTDLAVYRNGTWYLLQSTQGFTAFQFGIAADIPTPADYDGDGRADAAVFRNGTWYIAQSSNGAVTYQQFGLSSDIPVAGASQ